jgi:hypothetical protein
MDIIYQIYQMATLGLAIIAAFLIMAFHILGGREED